MCTYWLLNCIGSTSRGIYLSWATAVNIFVTSPAKHYAIGSILFSKKLVQNCGVLLRSSLKVLICLSGLSYVCLQIFAYRMIGCSKYLLRYLDATLEGSSVWTVSSSLNKGYTYTMLPSNMSDERLACGIFCPTDTRQNLTLINISKAKYLYLAFRYRCGTRILISKNSSIAYS